MTTPAARAERVYEIICAFIEGNNAVPEISDIMTGCALSRPQVDRATADLQAMGYLLEDSLLPTAHFPDVPF